MSGEKEGKETNITFACHHHPSRNMIKRNRFLKAAMLAKYIIGCEKVMRTESDHDDYYQHKRTSSWYPFIQLFFISEKNTVALELCLVFTFPVTTIRLLSSASLTIAEVHSLRCQKIITIYTNHNATIAHNQFWILCLLALFKRKSLFLPPSYFYNQSIHNAFNGITVGSIFLI